MVLCEYRNSIYDALGDVDVVAKQVNKEQIKEIGKIILAHGYGEDVCLVIAHRHFNLAASEVMLENAEGEKRIAKPVEMNKIESLGAFPNTIVCQEGKWYPVGYGINEDNVLKVCNDKVFLDEVGSYLVRNGLQNKYMLGARCSKEEKAQGVYFMEYNFEETRTSETRPCEMSEFAKGVETTYSFVRGSDGMIEETCVRVCQPLGGGHLFAHVPFARESGGQVE